MDTTKFYTGTLHDGESLQIVASMNVIKISWQCISGVTTVLGGAYLNGVAPSELTHEPGEGATVEAGGVQNPVDMLTLTAVGGDTAILVAFS